VCVILKAIGFSDIFFAAAVSYQQLIAYGSKLANFTSVPPTAPADDKEPAPGPYGFYPPFPDTEMMQRAKLALQGPIGPVGETRVIGDTKGTILTLIISLAHAF
jgi:hypothetical protein